MKKELQYKLFKKYPKIFKQRTQSMSKTCMCWGIECPDSWYKILDKLCKQIQTHVDLKGMEQVEVVQAKEKFGYLRFYTNHYDPTIDSLIDKAEQKTMTICAACGSDEGVKATKGWITYLCKSCRSKKEVVWS